jgi:hypothetical protein
MAPQAMQEIYALNSSCPLVEFNDVLTTKSAEPRAQAARSRR